MTAVPTGAHVSPIARRVVAFAIDLVVCLGLAGTVLALTDEPWYAALTLLETVVAICVWEARTGRTVGNSVLGLRTVRVDGLLAPGIGRVARRALVVGAGFLVAAVGQWAVVASGAWDRSPRRQGWHDAFAGTLVVDVSRRSAATAGRGTPAPRADPWGPMPVAGPATFPQVQDVAPRPGPARPVPAAPAPVAARPPEDAASRPRRYVLAFDNGQTFTVSGTGLVGRRPESAAGEHHDAHLAIDDAARSVSKTHLEFGVDGTGFWVSDRGSTNGTTVLTSSGDPLDVLVGMRVHVPADGSVRVGERQFTARPAAG
ncbi:RDD family protein [Sanguibacter suaedae]|uniref:RDD family protein n=1 Tax=Sanguibacter suaedae TaxID=2795737 RepID=A0A934I8X5_9MICO|nr:RDD family protein [Sanguibacter suaedae]MBI9114365.1 RDD family protein [Sanguibacter suaedae]